VEEIEAWSPFIIRSLIKLAVAWLPENQRERFGEEWHSHVNEVPGNVGKFLSAVGFLLAAINTRLAFRRKPLFDRYLEALARYEHSHSEVTKALTEIQSDKDLASRPEVQSALNNLHSYLSKCEAHYSELEGFASQISDIPPIPTTPRTLIGQLRIRHLKNVAMKQFANVIRRREQVEERCADFVKVVDDWQRGRRLMAAPTKPTPNEPGEK